MNRPSKLRILLLVLATSGICLLGPRVSAQEQQQPVTGLTVTPGIVYTSVSNSTQATQTVITVRNNYATPVNLTAELRGVDETSTRLLPTDSLPKELNNVFAVSETQFTIAPLSDYKITLQSQLTDNLGPGGHYASLLISQAPDANNNISLKSAVSVTVFLTNQEGAEESLKLENLQIPASLFTIGNKVIYSLQNNGNIHTTPRGVVTIEGKGGKLLAQGVINTGSNIVLPGRTLSSETKLAQVSDTWWPQRVTTRIQFRANNSAKITEASSSHFYIPPIFLGLIAGAVGLAILIFLSARRVLIFKRSRKNHPKKSFSNKKPAKPSLSAKTVTESTPTTDTFKDSAKDDDQGVKIPVRVKKP